MTNNYDEYNVMCASVWVDVLILCQHPLYTRGICDIWEHLFPRVLEYKRSSDIEDDDITEVRV